MKRGTPISILAEIIALVSLGKGIPIISLAEMVAFPEEEIGNARTTTEPLYNQIRDQQVNRNLDHKKH